MDDEPVFLSPLGYALLAEYVRTDPVMCRKLSIELLPGLTEDADDYELNAVLCGLGGMLNIWPAWAQASLEGASCPGLARASA